MGKQSYAVLKVWERGSNEWKTEALIGHKDKVVAYSIPGRRCTDLYCVNVAAQGALHYIRWGVSLLWPGASQWGIYYHRMWGQLSTTCSNLLKQHNGELLDHSQLRTMASETAYQIDWSHSLPSWAEPSERLVHSINQRSLSRKSTFQPQHARQPPCLCCHSGNMISIG